MAGWVGRNEKDWEEVWSFFEVDALKLAVLAARQVCE